MSKIYVGMDPGLDGGFGVVDGASGALLDCLKFPVYEPGGGRKGREYDLHGINDQIEQISAEHGEIFLVIENVTWNPQQTKMNTLTLMKLVKCQAYVEGICTAAGIPYQTVLPQKWKKVIGIPPKSDKEVSRQTAIRIWPAAGGTWFRYKTTMLGPAEAALIAEYARRENL